MLLPTLRRLAAVALLVSAGPAFAQSVLPSFSYVILKEEGDYNQTSSAAPTTRSDAQFEVDVYGGNAFTITSAPTVTIGGGSKAGSTVTLGSDGFMYSFQDSGTGSGYRSLSGSSGVYASYGAGNYTVNVAGQSFSVAFPAVPNPNASNGSNGFANFVPSVPSLTLTGGTWSGGTYVVNAGTTVGLTSGAFSSNFNSGSSAISLNAFNQNSGSILLVDSTVTTGANSSSLSASLNSLQAGNYQVQLEFDTAFDLIRPDDVGNPLPGAYVLGGFSQVTTLNIEVVPEPSGYGIWAGVASVTGLAWRHLRRRRNPGEAKAIQDFA